jgi:hypothetical protein
MRKFLIASLVVAGVGVLGVTSGPAAPVNNSVFKQLSDMSSATSTEQVGWHGRYRSHWRWGSRGGGGGGRCHVRWRSFWRWC